MPYHFLISAVAMGLSMVSFEAMLSKKFLHHEVDNEVFYGLARGCLIVLSFYLVVKLYQWFVHAGIGAAFDGTIEANMFLLEMLIGVIIPIVILSIKKYRTNVNIIFKVNIIVIAGVLLNRMNVCLFSMEQFNMWKGFSYTPSWMEFMVSLGIIFWGFALQDVGKVSAAVFALKTRRSQNRPGDGRGYWQGTAWGRIPLTCFSVRALFSGMR
jgi:Ni/Fe-hydrogenase subunit HybB-like protein